MSKYGLDKFYTKKNVVKNILDTLDLSEYDVIIEPQAGNGQFSDEIPNCIQYDIDPENNNIIKQDFLSINLDFDGKVLIIGNPPFGRNGSKALQFIKKSSMIASTIAFILPKSFKKESYYNKIPLNFWKIKEFDLDQYSFTYNGEEVDIPCVFQIYERRNIKRNKYVQRTTDLFKFVPKDKSNVQIRRVGVYQGKASLDILNKSTQSHYFILVENPEQFISKVNTIQWKHNNTVGPRSISKSELIDAIEKLWKE